MATQSVSKRDNLVSQVRNSLPVLDRATSQQEVEFLLLMRKASPADRQRMTKFLSLIGKGLLPTAEQYKCMTMDDWRAFADKLPEVANGN